jgi:hypothetical protein
MTDYKAELFALRRELDAAQQRANAFTDPDLTPAGLQARREQIVATARQAAGPVLEQLRAGAARDAAALTGRAAQLLPQQAADADTTARVGARWAAIQPLLAAGKPLRDVLASADAETAHAIASYGPSFAEAAAYRPGQGDQPAPDHGPLLRAVDARLAALSGPDAVAALVAAHESAAVAAGVEVAGRHLADTLAGVNTGSTELGSSLDSHYAEQAARQGLAAADGGA